MRNKKVTIILVTYNSSRFVDGCFSSLKKMNRTGLDVRVVALDNDSYDGTLDLIKENHPWVEARASGGNFGFAGGNNIVIREAIERGDDYVYLLNLDTEVDPDFLVEAIKVMESDESIGSVQSLLLLHPEKDLVNSTGNAIHFLGFGYCQDYRRNVEDVDTETVRDIAYPAGASVLFRCSTLRRVGLFDEELFIYHEDLDLGWRMRLAGYRNVLAPKSKVWHKYEFSRSIGKWYYMERNRYIVLFKNLRLWSLLLITPGLVATETMMAFTAIRGGWWRKKIRAMGYFLNPAVWKYLSRERSRVNALRRVGDKSAMEIFTYEIRDQEGTSFFVTLVANPLMGRTWAIIKHLIA